MHKILLLQLFAINFLKLLPETAAYAHLHEFRPALFQDGFFLKPEVSPWLSRGEYILTRHEPGSLCEQSTPMCQHRQEEPTSPLFVKQVE